MFTSIIRHPARRSFIQIHEWQLVATDNDKAAAALLSVFEYRHNALVENREFDTLVRTASKKAGFVLPPDFKYWFCFTDAELIRRVKIAQKEAIYKGIDNLTAKGFLSTDVPEELRTLVGTGRRKWFRLNIDAINDFIDRYDDPDRDTPDTSPAVNNTATDAVNAKSTASDDSPTGIARRVFDDWKELHNSPRSVLDNKRLGLIKRLVKDGFTEARLKLATRGILTSDWHFGFNKFEKTYNQFELIFRDAEHVERFESMALDCGVTVDNYLNYRISKDDRMFRRASAETPTQTATGQPTETELTLAKDIAEFVASGYAPERFSEPDTAAAASMDLTTHVEAFYRQIAPLDATAKKRIRTVLEILIERKRQK